MLEVVEPSIEIDEDLGQHYNPFVISYKVFDNDPGITVVERINGNLLRTIILDNKEVSSIKIPKNIWRSLDNGDHTFSVELTDAEGLSISASSQFTKVKMPWYGTGKNIKVIGSRKPQYELIDLSKASIKIFTPRDLDTAHLTQDFEIDQYNVIDKIICDEYTTHKISQEENGDIYLSNHPSPQLVIPKKSIDLANVKRINGFEYEGTDVNIIFSFDDGVSWKGKYNYEEGCYTKITLDDLDSVIENSISIDNLDDINIDALNENSESRSLKIGYVMPLLTSCLNRFKINVTICGVFEKVPDEEYKVEYVNDTLVRITFNSSGTYKVNYLTGELTKTEYDELSEILKGIIDDLNNIKEHGVKVNIPEIDLVRDFVPVRYKAQIEYSEDDRLTREVYTGDTEKVVEYKYNGDLISEKIVTSTIDGSVRKSFYEYDNYDRLVKITDEGTDNSMSAGLIGMPIRCNVHFEYDNENRVVLEVYSGSVNKRVTYEYIGEHTKKKHVVYSNGEKYDATYVYDLNGNLISISDNGAEKIYTPLNKNAIACPRTISKIENTIYLPDMSSILNVSNLKKENSFNVILNSEILIKNEYKEESESVVVLKIVQDNIPIDTIHLYPQEVQKYSLGCSENTEIYASGRLTYSYSIGVI